MISSMHLTDRFGRRITYLRLSITDRCNLRCNYCFPGDNYTHLPKREILTYEEMTRIVSIFASCGIMKVRITGGEPLIKKNVIHLIRELKKIPGISEVAVTTNGVNLIKFIDVLPSLNLSSINVSLDTLNHEKFRILTGSDYLPDILDGIDGLLKRNFHGIKINVVSIKGINDDEILSFVRFAQENPVHVRFIEYMKTQNSAWTDNKFISGKEILSKINGYLPDLDALQPVPSMTARMYSSRKIIGRIGIISPVTSGFCRECSRIRLTADGRLFYCIFDSNSLNIKSYFRENMDDSLIMDKIREYVLQKPLKPDFFKNEIKNPMIMIGG
jgi:cyclic pyranopterin phosphate synthase